MEFQYRIKFSSETQQDTDLPLQFVARMLVIFLVWIRGMDHVLPPFLPFFDGLNLLRGYSGFYWILDWIYWLSLVLVFAGIRFRFFSLLLGLLIFFSILSSRLLYSNNFLYCGCLFFLIGMYRPGLNWIFRVQLALIYLGAGLNKLIDPDWISGQYMDYFFTIPYRNELYIWLSERIPGKLLGQILAWLTIFTELGFSIWAFLNRNKIWLVFAILIFHLTMLLVTAGELSYLFFFLMTMSGYLILPWEENKGRIISFEEKSWFFRFLKFLDFDNFFIWKSGIEEKIHLIVVQKQPSLVCHLSQSLVFHKALVSLFTLGIVFLCRYRNHILNLF